MSNALDNHDSKWYYLVNILAGAMVTIMGFIVKSLEFSNFEMSRLYTIYLLIIFLIYFILRLPEFVSRLLLIYIEYTTRLKKARKNGD